MSAYNNLYAQNIYEIISPIIGELMAKGSLRAQCKHMGITEDSIQHKDIPALSERLRKGLVLFLGTENANLVAAKILKI
jgi:hypothetical protein